MSVVVGSVQKTSIPKGWKILNVWLGEGLTVVYISPHGKRFMSLDAVRKYIHQFPSTTHRIEKTRKRKHESDQKPAAKRFKLDLVGNATGKLDSTLSSTNKHSDLKAEKSTEGDGDTEGKHELSPKIKEKRRQMALRSPFRDLLKKTLMKNQKVSCL
eukprot:TRINITY_DN35551_c0_g1_i1.p1 TRINITY_DN35551_c0_g1~~TRINITY_DN35551_c0_g1_i1.p1  ORF type:complete len:157 (-),score=27.67 TRINITY_DN35551_c0_g1_i1:42-512(-)